MSPPKQEHQFDRANPTVLLAQAHRPRPCSTASHLCKWMRSPNEGRLVVLDWSWLARDYSPFRKDSTRNQACEQLFHSLTAAYIHREFGRFFAHPPFHRRPDNKNLPPPASPGNHRSATGPGGSKCSSQIPSSASTGTSDAAGGGPKVYCRPALARKTSRGLAAVHLYSLAAATLRSADQSSISSLAVASRI